MSIKKIRVIILALSCIYTTATFASESQQQSIFENTKQRVSFVEDKVGIKPNKGSLIESLYKEAVDWLKTPYRYGGNSKKGIDCSAFTGAIYSNVYGVKLNRSSKAISAKDVNEVNQDQLQPGDLVFFATSRRKSGVSHVGIYLGNRFFVHASSQKGVTISSLDEPFYKRTYVKGGQVKDLDPDLINKSDLQHASITLKPLYVEASKDVSTIAISSEVLLKKIPESVIVQ